MDNESVTLNLARVCTKWNQRPVRRVEQQVGVERKSVATAWERDVCVQLYTPLPVE
jgi:hypothetical protein